ncbi:MAG: LamG-like jellyroll fold domain-containing protein, partial [Wenzhouxiangella sp.]|nr:LamG-like jellyroll fold domain-containing protein [Wenzhouxiangella sp.]
MKHLTCRRAAATACLCLGIGLFTASHSAAESSPATKPDWLATAPTLQEFKRNSVPAARHDDPLFELAACLAVVQGVKVAARHASQEAPVPQLATGAEFEYFLRQAEALEARARTHAGVTQPALRAAFWESLQRKSQGRELREAMLDRLGGDETLAQNCIALPAMIERIELEAWHAKNKAKTSGGASQDPRGVDECSIAQPSEAPVPFRNDPAISSTGAELIYWGGQRSLGSTDMYNSGFIYDYATDTWSLLTGTGDVPSPRFNAYSVASATQFIVYSGSVQSNSAAQTLNTGAVLDIATRNWTATSTSNAPVVSSASVVWTGSEMILWGGSESGQRTNAGYRYSPSSNTWTGASTSGAPVGRTGHTAVWTGSEMLVFGGSLGYDNTGEMQLLIDGGRYNPSTDSWSGMTPANMDVSGTPPRTDHTAVWTGSEMIVWGGRDADFDYLDEGLRYNAATDSWTATAFSPQEPTPRVYHSAVWTGSEMIIWAGITGFIVRGGSAYNPSTDSWDQLPINTTINDGRADFFATFTNDNRMLVFGNGFSSVLSPGEFYDPDTDSWSQASDSIVLNDPAAVEGLWTFNEFPVGQVLLPGFRIDDECGNRDARTAGTLEVVSGVGGNTKAAAFEAANSDAAIFDPGYDFGSGANAGPEFDFAHDDSFVVEAIVRIPDGSTQTGSIVAKDVGPGQASWWLRVENGVLRALVGDAAFQPSVLGMSPINDGEWHHVAMVRDAINRELRLYVDYQLDARAIDTTAGDIATPGGTNIVIGGFNDGNRQLEGEVERARILTGRLPSNSAFLLHPELTSLSAAITSSEFMDPGQVFTYEISFSNAGPADASNVLVESPLPAEFPASTWTCAGSGGGSCTGSGSDGIVDAVELPAGGSV